MVYRAFFRYLRHCHYWGKIPFIDDVIDWAATMAALMRAHPRPLRPVADAHKQSRKELS